MGPNHQVTLNNEWLFLYYMHHPHTFQSHNYKNVFRIKHTLKSKDTFTYIRIITDVSLYPEKKNYSQLPC